MGAEPDDETLAFAQGLFELARQGGAARLGEYLDAGLTPDLTDAKGDTLLVLAAYHEHEETVRVLLAHGADHGRVNDKGQTAVGSAVFRRHEGSSGPCSPPVPTPTPVGSRRARSPRTSGRRSCSTCWGP